MKSFFSLQKIRSNPEIIPVLCVLGFGMGAAILMTGRQAYYNPGVALFDKSKSFDVPRQDFDSSGLFGRFHTLRDRYFPGTKTYQ
jgi:hypothetical protein